MCVAGCREAVQRQLSRRGFIRGVAAGGSAMALGACASDGGRHKHGRGHRHHHHQGFDKVADLSHQLHEDFPTFSGEPQFSLESVYNYSEHYFNENQWTLLEHTGTHMDAPIHFSEAGSLTMDEIPVRDLVVPLVVVDIRAKAAADADALLTPEDLQAWESEHGPIPEGACVAMNSGWDARVNQAGAFRNADDAGIMHFPGFHPDSAQFLMEERDCKGLAVDTLSLDYGGSSDFPVHYSWLPSNRWGLECVANLANLPAKGVTLVVGAPKFQGASGGPTRLIALY